MYVILYRPPHMWPHTHKQEAKGTDSSNCNNNVHHALTKIIKFNKAMFISFFLALVQLIYLNHIIHTYCGNDLLIAYGWVISVGFPWSCQVLVATFKHLQEHLFPNCSFFGFATHSSKHTDLFRVLILWICCYLIAKHLMTKLDIFVVIL